MFPNSLPGDLKFLLQVVQESVELGIILEDIQDKRVTLLTSDSNVWQNIEAGTRIVMRVIFEQLAYFSATTYKCHLCGELNKLVSYNGLSEWLTDGSVNWFVLCVCW